MPKLTQREAIIKALQARGEKRVEDRSLSKYEKWTRTYGVPRDPEGKLQPHPAPGTTFYFIGKTGALRVGATSTSSHSYQGKLRNVLILEGRSLDA